MSATFRQLAIGALAGTGLLAGSIGVANAAACGTSSVAAILAGSFSCTQQDKIWSNFTSTSTGDSLATLAAATAQFSLVNIGSVDEHTLTIEGTFSSAPPVQPATYELAYTITMDPAALLLNPALSFIQATGGILTAAAGGTGSLTKSFVGDGGAIPGLTALAIGPASVNVPVPVGTTTINVDDAIHRHQQRHRLCQHVLGSHHGSGTSDHYGLGSQLSRDWYRSASNQPHVVTAHKRAFLQAKTALGGPFSFLQSR